MKVYRLKTNPSCQPIIKGSGFLLAPAVSLLVLLIATVLSACSPLKATEAAIPTVSPARLQSYPTLGSPDAKVKIVEYGDFGCTTCKAWFNSGTLEKLRQTYGDKIAFIWRDFTIITPQSPKASEAGQCAFDQGKFWEYHDYLYGKAPGISVSDLKNAAVAVGMDAQTFNQCLDSGKYGPMVAQSTSEAKSLGFLSTPAFIIDGRKMEGPQDFVTIKVLIDPVLNGQG
jgi:protein-disulfide isomerase